MLEKTPESLLDDKEIKSVNLKGNQPWIVIGKIDAEAETPVFWSPDVKSWLIGKVRDAGKDWGQNEKRASEDELTGWHHGWNGHELGQTSGDSEGQRGLECCSPWGLKELEMTGQATEQCNKNPSSNWLLAGGCLQVLEGVPCHMALSIGSSKHGHLLLQS